MQTNYKYKTVEELFSEGYKLYDVGVEKTSTVYVIAKDKTSAESLAIDYVENSSDDDWETFAEEVENKYGRYGILDDWGDCIPVAGRNVYTNAKCIDFVDYLKEQDRKKKVAEELDKKQLKFDL